MEGGGESWQYNKVEGGRRGGEGGEEGRGGRRGGEEGEGRGWRRGGEGRGWRRGGEGRGGESLEELSASGNVKLAWRYTIYQYIRR